MMEISIYKYAESIETKQEFDFFLRMLIKDFTENEQDWNNYTLLEFLKGINRYCEDTNVAEPLSWKQVAKLFLAAKVYE